MVSVGSTGGLHHAAHQSLGAGAHVHRRGAQPELIDADHFSRPVVSSRNQALQSSPADVGQRTLRCSGPRRSSTWMSGPAVGVVPTWPVAVLPVVLGGAGISIATNSGLAASSGDSADTGRLASSRAGVDSTGTPARLSPRPVRQVRTRLAFRPCARATPEIDAPGSLQAASTLPLSSALWRRRGPDLECICLLYTSPSPRDGLLSRMPSSA